MDISVRNGTIKYVNLVDDKTDFDTYYIECVKNKDTKTHLWIWEEMVVNTEDILLKYCPFCSRGL